jgi:3-methylfumaryl-CoA hydratase
VSDAVSDAGHSPADSTADSPQLVDAGFAPESVAPVTHDAAHRLASCLAVDPAVLDGGTLPTLWHWATFLPDVPAADLGPDGHPRRRPEMAGFPQRMWVGGRVQAPRPLRLGETAERTSRILRADPKDGSTGRFWLVTVGHTVTQGGATCIEEEQDLVLREASAVVAPGPDRDDTPETPWGDGAWVEPLTADPVLLFRFSAATANAHRIHYDHPYATGVEGYPDLVVHGPLTALLLAELARRRSGAMATGISFRARAPHYANRRCWLTGGIVDGGADTAAIRADHTVSMTLEARW